MTAAEVARYEHIPLGTAKTRIRVAKQCLRRELSSLSWTDAHRPSLQPCGDPGEAGRPAGALLQAGRVIADCP